MKTVANKSRDDLNSSAKMCIRDRGSLHNLFHREMLKKEAVKDISFSVERGEMIGLLGPNGAGKTTTLDRKSTRLNSSHSGESRMPSSA